MLIIIHIFKATAMKFGVSVRTWDTLPAPNFCKNRSGALSLMDKFLRIIRNFRNFELLKPTPILMMLKFYLRERT